MEDLGIIQTSNTALKLPGLPQQATTHTPQTSQVARFSHSRVDKTASCNRNTIVRRMCSRPEDVGSLWMQ